MFAGVDYDEHLVNHIRRYVMSVDLKDYVSLCRDLEQSQNEAKDNPPRGTRTTHLPLSEQMS